MAPPNQKPAPLDAKLSAKLGSRLALVASLKDEDLDKLRDAEKARSAKVGEGIRDARKLLKSAKTPQAIQAARSKLARQLDRIFVPITTGVYRAAPSADKSPWKEKIDEDYVAVLIVAKDVPETAFRQAMVKIGVKPRVKSGNVYTALVPKSSLAKLAADADKVVQRVEAARPVVPTVDYTLGDALQHAEIDQVQTKFTGLGVIVGVLDDGLDLRHPDFQTVAGGRITSRVIQYLRQADDTTPELELTGAEISAALNGDAGAPALPDPAGPHGTLVTGCAAGNGRAFDMLTKTQPPDPRTVGNRAPMGAAPGADIVFVARRSVPGTQALGDSVAAMEAFDYIFRKATAEGKACVVNWSESDDQGPHDGSSAVELFLDGLLATPGRAITLSAGNSNASASHAAGWVPPGSPMILELEFLEQAYDNAKPTNSDVVEIWYEAGSTLDLELTVPGAAATKVFSNVSAPGSAAEYVDGVTISVVSEVAASSDWKMNRITILIQVPLGNFIPIGTWEFKLTTTAVDGVVFDAWIDRNNRGFRGWLYPYCDENERTISVPATGNATISVGAVDPDDTALPESGRGPTRDGRPKPDVATIGSWTLAPATLSSSADSNYPYRYERGTSLAAPIVAGTCALMFESFGIGLTAAKVKEILGTDALLPWPTAVSAVGNGSLRAANVCDGRP